MSHLKNVTNKPTYIRKNLVNICIHDVSCPKYGTITGIGNNENGTITLVIMYWIDDIYQWLYHEIQ